jgi:hypothetical protein
MENRVFSRVQRVTGSGSGSGSRGFGWVAHTGHGLKPLGSAGAPPSSNFGSGCRSWRIGPPSPTLDLSVSLSIPTYLSLDLTLTRISLSLDLFALRGHSGKKNREEKRRRKKKKRMKEEQGRTGYENY